MIPSINLQVKLIDYALPAPTLISFKNLQTLLQIKKKMKVFRNKHTKFLRYKKTF